MLKENYRVYKHTSPNGKIYIGITQQELNKRWKNGLGYKRQDYFFNAISKYGWDSFKHEVLFENLTKEDAEQKEIELISFYKSNQHDFGYNVSNGGSSNGKHSEETKRKISQSNKGIKPASQTIEAVSKARKGIKLSEKHKQKISNACKGRKISEEAKRKISEANKEKGKPIEQIKDGVVIGVFKNSIHAYEQTGISSGNIRSCCRGERKNAGEYNWRYVNEFSL